MFELFAETIDGMPPPAVLSFLKRVHGSLEDALLYKRIDETPAVDSILCFCQFMNLLVENDPIFPIEGLPVKHVALYGKVVIRLVEAGEISITAKEKFEAAFSDGFLRSLANN
jgi:hypothetical protein